MADLESEGTLARYFVHVSAVVLSVSVSNRRKIMGNAFNAQHGQCGEVFELLLRV